MRRLAPDQVTRLGPGQVFVFGSNRQGFHGAGAAGLAFRGTSDPHWRTDRRFRAAMIAPPGSPDRTGRWAVFGRAQGFQEGSEGSSYAIVTVERPGMPRSVTLGEILDQLLELCAFALSRPDLEFLVTRIGCGLAGYSVQEIADLWRGLEVPDNVLLPACFESRG